MHVAVRSLTEMISQNYNYKIKTTTPRFHCIKGNRGLAEVTTMMSIQFNKMRESGPLCSKATSRGSIGKLCLSGNIPKYISV